MNIAVTFFSAASGTAAVGLVWMRVVTTFTKSPQPQTEPKASPDEQQTKELREEFKRIELQHKYFVENVLPLIPLGPTDDNDVLGTKRAAQLFQV